jgi:hypothetical protein
VLLSLIACETPSFAKTGPGQIKSQERKLTPNTRFAFSQCKTPGRPTDGYKPALHGGGGSASSSATTAAAPPGSGAAAAAGNRVAEDGTIVPVGLACEGRTTALYMEDDWQSSDHTLCLSDPQPEAIIVRDYPPDKTINELPSLSPDKTII